MSRASISSKVVGSLAAASVAGLAGQSQGAVHYTPANIPINATTSSGSIDFTGPGSGEVTITYGASSGITLNKGSAAKASFAEDPASPVPLPLASGESVAAAYTTMNGKLKTGGTKTKTGTLINPSGLPTGDFTQAAGEKYIGVSFEPVNTGPSYYGWIGFETTNDSSNADLAGVITGWAYEDSGGDILAGQTESVPEPSSLALLAAGGMGLAMYRKRRVG
jgi:hypothetical protein